jgi:SRSO17 transposase
MALHVEGGTVRGLQRFISDVHWDEEQMLWNYHQLVAEAMGEPDGVLMFDETGFVKKGKDSVGVARQYCGSLGKVENCQVGVFAGYASRQGYALVDKRLFLPEVWFTEAYAARRATCQVPPEATFATKPQLAAAMLQAIAPGFSRRRGRLCRGHDVGRDSCRHPLLAPGTPDCGAGLPL